MRITFAQATFALLIALPSRSYACDPCALYSASQLHNSEAQSFTVAAFEQYTDFDTAETLPENSIRNGELVKGFSTTQFLVAYQLNADLGLQLNLPLIYRRYDEIEKFRSSSESEFGIGDTSVVGSYSLYQENSPDWALNASTTVGIKLPTGDTGSIESSSLATDATATKHHPISGASGGRILTLGSGSVDYILGLQMFSRYQKVILSGYTQYAIRTEGDFDYEFADDFIWSFGPGYFINLSDQHSVAAKIALSGEHKNKDRLAGHKVIGSDFSNLYIGPELLATFNNISAELGVDFRVSDEDREATIVPEYKVRAGIAYRF